MKLARSERILLDFITEEMDDHNFITNCKQVRDKFNKLLKKIGQETYSDTTIHRCFANLAMHEIITNCKGRGLYQVSPIFFFRGSEEERSKVLREILERINKQPINKLRHELLSYKKVSSSPEPESD